MSRTGVQAGQMTGRFVEDEVADDRGVIAALPAIGRDQGAVFLVGHEIVRTPVGARVGRADPPELRTVGAEDHGHRGLSSGREGLDDIFGHDTPVDDQIVGVEGRGRRQQTFGRQGAQIIGCGPGQLHGSGKGDAETLRRRVPGAFLVQQRRPLAPEAGLNDRLVEQTPGRGRDHQLRHRNPAR